jgi:alcohol-forming fatty acyl-CoA reductase
VFHLNTSGNLSEPDNHAERLAFFSVEQSLMGKRSLRVAVHFALNAQAFSERAYRLLGVGVAALLQPVSALGNRELATRLLHVPLRGMSRDRLDLLGEEYFDYVLRPRLEPAAVQEVQRLIGSGRRVVLVSRELEHIIRPLAQFLGVHNLLVNRLEFRDNLATGRLQDPVVFRTLVLGEAFTTRSNTSKGENTDSPFEGGVGGCPRSDSGDTLRDTPRGQEATAPLKGGLSEAIKRCLHPRYHNGEICGLLQPTARQVRPKQATIVSFGKRARALRNFSVRRTLAGKQVLLIGSTGFIGKVWLSMLLNDLPELGRIYLLIRRQGSKSALQRFEKIVAESPVFKGLHERHGDGLPRFLADRLEVLEGDVAGPGLGLDAVTLARLFASLDLVVNSAGLTDFNPDLRLALSTNADSALHLAEFVRQCRHAGLIHVSTCFVNGKTDGRVPEELKVNYTPKELSGFDAQKEWQYLHDAMDRVNREAETATLTKQFQAEAMARTGKEQRATPAEARGLQNQVRRIRTRWVREQLIELGVQRAHHWGWPNIYTFTKSLGESLLSIHGSGLPVAIVRPSIVESSLSQPFRGWNEGVNTTAPLSYLLGTYFRQLPSNKRKRLDVIPVDLVCRGLTLVAAAVVLRRHEAVYQLATSATNPSDMRRAIELTCLAHRKHYRSLEGLEHWLRARFDTIAVSKTRYRNVSLPRFKKVLDWLQQILSRTAFKGEALIRKQRGLEKVQKVIELYEPFILDNEYFFAADHIKILSQALPRDEVEEFGYDSESIDWYDYWINLHVPARHHWTYPLVEGRRPETGLLPRSFKFLAGVESSSGLTPESHFQPVKAASGNGDSSQPPAPRAVKRAAREGDPEEPLQQAAQGGD